MESRMMSNETVADILREMRSNPLCWLMPEGIPQMCHDNAELTRYADRIEAAHNAEMNRRAIIAGVLLFDAVDEEHRREVSDLRQRLKLAEDALENLQSRIVSSVYDGSIDPHEALEIVERALAAIRGKGGD